MNKPLIILALTLTTLFSSPATYAEPPILSITETISNYKKGQIIAYFDKDGNLIGQPQSHYYRKYLGTTPEGYYLIQDFYSKSNKKQTDPIAVKSENDLNAWKLTTTEGISVLWYGNGQKQEEVNYKDGEKDGYWITWHENGQKRLKGHFINGKPDGLTTLYYPNGQKEVEGHSRNGKKEGLWTYWHENGQKGIEVHFKDDKKEGAFVSWDMDGKQSFEGFFRNDERVDWLTIIEENDTEQSVLQLPAKNQPHSTTIVSEYKKGQIIAYYDENFNLLREPSQAYYYRKYLGTTPQGYYILQGFYYGSDIKQSDPAVVKNREDFTISSPNTLEGTLVTWYENGQKESESHYINGRVEGRVTYWYENGQKLEEVYYKKGKENGHWISWHENGQKKVEGYYKNGKEDGHWIGWYENGQKLSDGYCKNGKFEGFWTFWHKNGQKSGEGYVKNSEPTGVWAIWDEDGNKQSIDDMEIMLFREQ